MRNLKRKWGTAILIHRRWRHLRWGYAETENAAFATTEPPGAMRIAIMSVHTPEAWHHTDDEDCAAAEMQDMLTQLHADEGLILGGVDANAGHCCGDIDGIHFGPTGAQEHNSSRNEMWANSVRTTGLRSINAWAQDEGHGTWTARQAGRERHIDWAITNCDDATTRVAAEMHCRSDHRPIVV